MRVATLQARLGSLRAPGAEREFERLYRRYVSDVYRYAVHVLRDPADAEDVTQAAFVNALRALRRGEEPMKPRAWLLAIVHNECLRHFRTRSRRPQEVELDEGVTADSASDADVPSPEEIRRALGQLSFNQRSALVMRELEGRSYAEIATTLDVSVSAVETLLFRARRALREQLEGSLTCGEAELALSKQLDRRLGADERASLRAHLRACKECARLARRQRAQRAALRSLGPLPLPATLTSMFGGGSSAGGLLVGGSALAGGTALKAAALLAGGAVATGVGLGAAEAGRAPDRGDAAVDEKVATVLQRPAVPLGAYAVLVGRSADKPSSAPAAAHDPGSAKLQSDGERAAADKVAERVRKPEARSRRETKSRRDGRAGQAATDDAPATAVASTPVAAPNVPKQVSTPSVTTPNVPNTPVTVPSVTVPPASVPVPPVNVPPPPPVPPVEPPPLPVDPPPLPPPPKLP